MSASATDTFAREASREVDGALEQIYRDFHQPLYRFCLAIVGNRQDAEEALQNTMVKVMRALPGEKRALALKPWLYRIAHNESIDLLRRRRENVSLESEEPKASEEPAAQAEARERLRHLIADLGALPDRQRQTLLMRESAGLSFEEIGAALETSPAVARQTLYEARLGLRQMDAGREMKCGAVTEALSDGDGRVRRRRDIRAHLRNCPDCRRFAEEIESRRDALASISPLPALAAAALLQGLVGGGSAGAGAAAGTAGAGGVGGIVGGAAAKSVGTATLLKGAATVAVVAAIGVGAADRGGLIQLGGGDRGANPPAGLETEDGSPDAGPDGSPSGSDPSAPASVDGTSSRPDAKTDVDRARAAEAPASEAPEAVPADPVTTAAEPETGSSIDASPGKSGAEHPSGPGHPKQTPAAAAHGQETAASHQPDKSGGPPGSAKSETASANGKSAEAPGQVKKAASPAESSPKPAGGEPKAASPPGKSPK